VGEAEAGQSPLLGENAQATYRQALDRARELEMRPLQARCHFGLGVLYRRWGRGADTQTELRAARDGFRAAGMPYWERRAEDALAQPGPD